MPRVLHEKLLGGRDQLMCNELVPSKASSAISRLAALLWVSVCDTMAKHPPKWTKLAGLRFEKCKSALEVRVTTKKFTSSGSEIGSCVTALWSNQARCIIIGTEP